MYKKLILIFTLICLASCHYEKKRAQKHDFSLYEEAEEQYLKAHLNCGADKMKDDSVCFCGTISLSCCEKKAKCKGDNTKKCEKKKDDKECKKLVDAGMNYYKKETEKMESLYCSKQKDDSSMCLCGMIDYSCCKSKSKCESKYLGTMRVCSDKLPKEQDCYDKIEKDLKEKDHLEKPWYYKRVANMNSAYTLFASICGVLALIALF